MASASATWRKRVFVVLVAAALGWSVAAAGDPTGGGEFGAAASAQVPLLDTLSGDDEDDEGAGEPEPSPAPAEPAPEPAPPPAEAPPPEPAPAEAQAGAEPSALGPTNGSASGPALQPGNMPAGEAEPFAGQAPAPMVAPGVEVAPPLSDAPLAAPAEQQLASSPIPAGAGVPEPAVPDLMVLSVLALLLLRYQRRSRTRFQPRW